MRPINAGLLITIALLAGCAAPSKYVWGDYERALYGYYKDPAKAPELATAIEKSIQASEQTQKPVAPGMYAEYGFLLLQQGKPNEAVPYFEKEKAKWPESTYLMNSMIQTATKSNVKPPESKQP